VLAGEGDPTQADFDQWRIQVNGQTLSLADRQFAEPAWDARGRFTVRLTLSGLTTPAPWRIVLTNGSESFRLETLCEQPDDTEPVELSAETTARALLSDRLAALGKPDLPIPDEAVGLLALHLEKALIDSTGDPLATSPLFTAIQSLAQALVSGVPASRLGSLPGVNLAPQAGGSGGGTVAIVPPTVTGFNPVGGAGVGLPVTIIGTGFIGTTAVSFNGTAQPTFTVVSDSQITTTVPAGATTGTIEVTNPLGVSPSGPFTVIPTPTVTGLNPVGSLAVGAAVTITGTDLTGATAVSFNGTAQPTFTVVDATTITTTVPAGATTGPIAVTTPGGTATSGSLTVIPTPVITSFSPATGAFAAGPFILPGTVTITGTGLTGATAVSFNGTAQPTFTVVDDTTITTTVPFGGTTGAIQVTTPGGTGTSGAFPVPDLPTFVSGNGGQIEGTPVPITGTNLTGAYQARFPMGTSPQAVTVVTSALILVTTPTDLPTPGGFPFLHALPNVFIDFPGGSLIVPLIQVTALP
jgi:hypothetical protein